MNSLSAYVSASINIHLIDVKNLLSIMVMNSLDYHEHRKIIVPELSLSKGITLYCSVFNTLGICALSQFKPKYCIMSKLRVIFFLHDS